MKKVPAFLLPFLFFTVALAEPFHTSYALVIGIGDYPYKAWHHLPYAKKDAHDMATYLASQGYVIDSIYDSGATKERIITSMQKLARKITNRDRILVFFSGHGYTESYGGEDYGYLVPYDATGTSSTYLSMEEFRGLADKMKAARHQLFIVDACYGGLLQTKDLGLKTVNPDYRREPRYLDEATRRPAREILLAGGKDQQVLAGGEGKNSHFTFCLLEALRNNLADINGDGYITFSELCGYIVPRASNDYQTPAYGSLPGHGLGEYIFNASGTNPSTAEKTPRNDASGILRKGGTERLVDSGSFVMGSDKGDADEKPPHKETMKRFFMDVTEVTNSQYDECVRSGACTPPAYNDGTAFIRSGTTWKMGVVPEVFREPANPVVAVTRAQAQAYCTWKGGRLPTEAEWEYAARAASPTAYYWGDDTAGSCRYANTADSTSFTEYTVSGVVTCSDRYAGSAPVGSYEPNWFGFYDMLGNVWEWCAGYYAPYTSDTVHASPPADTSYAVIRGGSWSDGIGQCRSSNRRYINPENRSVAIGFRCVREE